MPDPDTARRFPRDLHHVPPLDELHVQDRSACSPSVAELRVCITFPSPTARSSLLGAVPLPAARWVFLDDRLWNFPALLVPDGFMPHPFEVAVVAVAPDEGLHLTQQLLAELRSRSWRRMVLR